MSCTLLHVAQNKFGNKSALRGTSDEGPWTTHGAMPVRRFSWMASVNKQDEEFHLLRHHLQDHPLLGLHLGDIPRTMLGIANTSRTWRREATDVESAELGPGLRRNLQRCLAEVYRVTTRRVHLAHRLKNPQGHLQRAAMRQAKLLLLNYTTAERSDDTSPIVGCSSDAAAQHRPSCAEHQR